MPSLTDYRQTLRFRRRSRFLSLSFLALGLFVVCGFSSALYALPMQQLKPVGQVRSPQFSPSFLAIWLSDYSLKPALTRQLKGEKP